MTVIVRHLGLRDYAETFARMQRFTERRGPATPDELWFLEHPPVYTLGLVGRREHILDAGAIPVLGTDRGGQVTYHGPGQLVTYVLVDLRRRGMAIRTLVRELEQAVIGMLAEFGIAGGRMARAPGIYVGEAKIAALGLRVRRGCTYHGLALNVDLDPEPFRGINPCGYPGLVVTRLADFVAGVSVDDAAARLSAHLLDRLGYPHAAAPAVPLMKSPDSRRVAALAE